VAPRGARTERFDVVGPVCESTDVLGVDRALAVEVAICWPSCRPALTEW
jgi:diaminopimelate decarboxylase